MENYNIIATHLERGKQGKRNYKKVVVNEIPTTKVIEKRKEKNRQKSKERADAIRKRREMLSLF